MTTDKNYSTICVGEGTHTFEKYEDFRITKIEIKKANGDWRAAIWISDYNYRKPFITIPLLKHEDPGKSMRECIVASEKEKAYDQKNGFLIFMADPDDQENFLYAMVVFAPKNEEVELYKELEIAD